MDLVSTVGERDSISTPGGGIYSPLSTALFFVLLHAGSHGLSVCEALRKLVGQGYSKLLNSNIHMRALQVKSALRGCPAFKELESRRFILRFNRQDESRNSRILRCKSKNYYGKKQGKASSCEKGLNVGGSCNESMQSPEREPCVESPFNQPEIVPDEGLQKVALGDRETFLHIGPSMMSEEELPALGSCCTPTVNNASGHSLDDRKNERVEGACVFDDGCKSKYYHGKKQGNASSCEKGLNVGGSCNEPMQSPEREPCVESPLNRPESPFNQSEIVLNEGLQMVALGDLETLSHISPSMMSEEELPSSGSCCTPTLNNASGHSLDDRKNERAEGGCMFDDGCKSKNYHGKKQGNASSCEKGWNVGGSCNEPMQSPEREPCVESPFNQPEIVPDEGLQMVALGDRETLSHISPSMMSEEELPSLGSCCTPTVNNASGHSLDDRKNERVEGGCMFDDGCIQHTSLGSLHSDRSNQNMRGDGGESIFLSQCKDGHDLSGRIVDHYPKDSFKLGRCRRTDGKRWQCSKQVQLGSIYCEHHHIVRKKGKIDDAFGRVVRAAARTRFPSSIRPSESFVDKHVIKEEEGIQLEPLMSLAIMSACVSAAQSEVLSVEEVIPEVQEEIKPYLHMLDLEDMQRSKKKQKVAGHGQSVMVEGAVHGGGKETKTDPHVRCEVEEERKPYLHESELHDLDDVQRLMTVPEGAGPRQSVMLEKAIPEGQEKTKTDLHVPEFNGFDHMQGLHEISMPRGHGMLEVKKEVPETDSSFEDATVTYKGEGLQAEPLGPNEKSLVAAKMPCLFLEDFKKRLVDLGDSSSEGKVYLERSLHASNRCFGPKGITDVHRQCHRHNGKGWQCSRQCKPGYMYCEHHQGRDSKRVRSSKGKRKMILQLELDKQVLATCLKGNSDMQVLRVAIDVPQSLVEGLKAKVTQGNHITGERDGRHEGENFRASGFVKTPCSHMEKSMKVTGSGGGQVYVDFSSSSGRLPEGSRDCQEGILRLIERCHRKDGKGWQCSQQCKHGSIYCDRHQRGHHKSRFPSGSQQKLALSREPDDILTEQDSDIHIDMKQPAVDMVLEQTLEPKVQGQREENKNCSQDDMGAQPSSVATPVLTDLNACYLGEKNTTSGKAETNVKKCHRRDGKKWQCSRVCMPGYNHCEHHQGRGRRGNT